MANCNSCGQTFEARQISALGITLVTEYCSECLSKKVVTGPKCATCADAGFVHPCDNQGHVDYRQSIPCPGCNRDWLIASSRLPRQSRELKRLTTWKSRANTEEAYKAAVEFIAGAIHPPMLLLWGGPGTGKTHLALAIGWQFLESSRSVLYFQAEELLERLRADFDKDGNRDNPMMDRVRRIGLLILDDLGAHQKTEWAAVQLDKLVNYRWENDLPTVATANSIDLQPRVLDRLRDGRIVRIRAESFRGQKGQKND